MMRFLCLIITIFLGILVITTAVLFQLTTQTDLPMIVVLGRIDGDDGIYRLNPHDDEVLQLFDAGSGHIQLPDDRLLVSSAEETIVINPRNPNVTVAFEVPRGESLLSFSPAGKWLLYIEEDTERYLDAINAVPGGQRTIIPIDSPGVRHMALWGQSRHIILGSISEATKVFRINLESGASENIAHGQLILPSVDTWSPRVHREQIFVIDETGCLKSVRLSDGAVTTIFDQEVSTNYELLHVNPDWLVFSEKTEVGLSLLRLDLESNQTEQIWFTQNPYSIAYASPDGSMFVFEEEAASNNLHIFTEERGLQVINHDLDGPSVVTTANESFVVFQGEDSQRLGTTHELVQTDGVWHIQPVVPDPRRQTPTPQGWIVLPKPGFEWSLLNTITGKEYPLHANIASHTRFRILEFEHDARAAAKRNLLYVALGLAVLLGLSQMGFIQRRSIMP